MHSQFSFSWDEYNNAYNRAPEDVRLIIDSGKLGECITTFITAPDDAVRHQLVIEAANYLVGLHNRDTLLSQFPEEMKDAVGNIITCLDANRVTPAAPTTNPPKIRTMAQDMSVAQDTDGTNVYRSSQDAVLTQPQPPTPPIQDTRWQ